MTAYTTRRKNRMGVTFYLLIAVILPVTCTSAVGISIAAENVCEKLLSKEASKSLSSGQIKQIQLSLDKAGYAPEKIDGIMGPLTQAALKNYCDEFEKEFRKESIDEFIAKLALYAAIAKDYPQWKEIVKNEKFKLWIDNQPVGEKVAYHIIMRTWSAKDIISLYKKYKSNRARQYPKPLFDRTYDYAVSYKLTENNLKQLKAESDIVSGLKELTKEEPNSDEEDFLKKAQKTTKLNEKEFKKNKELILKSAQKSSYLLTDISFKKLEGKFPNSKLMIPNAIVDNLKENRITKYLAEANFNTYLEDEINEVFKPENYQSRILKIAKIEGPYRISPEFLKRLKEKHEVPKDFLGRLKSLSEKRYPDLDTLKNDVRPIIDDVIIEYNFPDKTISKFSELRIKEPEIQREGAITIIKKEKVDYENYRQIILDEVDKLPLYILTTQSRVRLKGAKVPDDLISKLLPAKNKGGLIDQGYSDEDSFKSALSNMIQELADDYRNLIVKSAEIKDEYQLNDLDIVTLKDKLKIQKIPEEIMDVLNAFKGAEYPNKDLFENALYFAVRENDQTLITQLPEYKNRIIAEAKKKHEFAEKKDSEVPWSGEDCGCVLDLKKVVYGFYPFWMAVKAEKGKKKKLDKQKNDEKSNNKSKVNGDDKILIQNLDFSVLSRIGYYSLPIGVKGNIETDKIEWVDNQEAKFIKIAHKYRTKVDIVLYNEHWKKWKLRADEQGFSINDVFAAKLADWVKKKDYDWYMDIFYSFPGRQPPMVDGITLDFDSYLLTDESVNLFNDYIKKLHHSLNSNGKKYFLNLLFPLEAIGQGAYQLNNLLNIADNVDLFLVYLDEPTEKNRILLSKKIKDNFEKVVNQDTVRFKIVAIANPDIQNNKISEDVDNNIFKNDLDGYKNDFGGVGFWPLPVNKSKSGYPLNTVLAKVFQNEDLESGLSQICNFQCQHRFTFYYIWDAMLILGGIYFLLFLSMCPFRMFYTRFKPYFLGFGVITIILTLIIFTCDPHWQDRQWLIIISLFVSVIIYILWQIYVRKKRANNP